MTHKKDTWFTVIVIAAILAAFTVADFFNEERLFSATENRVLTSRPQFSIQTFLDGSFAKDYENYVTDQFVSRDKWIRVKTGADILMQKKLIGGVYLCSDDYLIEYHEPADYPSSMQEEKLALLKTLVDRWDAKVMLVPTADNILTDKLPANAIYLDERAFLDRAEEVLGADACIDVYGMLAEHSGEDIYYRTDHHWTSLGAYYGYLAWAQANNMEPYDYAVDKMQTVSTDFYGTLQAKTGTAGRADNIRIFPETLKRPVKVTYDFSVQKTGIYEESYLDTRNQYGYFLDDNHPFIEISTGYRNEKSLFILKDSYANCLIPLLKPHYGKIYVMDLRYFNGSLFPFMETYAEQGNMDVLVLYNCIHFLEDFRYFQ